MRVSKLGDGNRVKAILARKAVDRYSMAEALDRAGCRMVIGDFMFALGLPLPMHSLRTVRFAAALEPVLRAGRAGLNPVFGLSFPAPPEAARPGSRSPWRRRCTDGSACG